MLFWLILEIRFLINCNIFIIRIVILRNKSDSLGLYDYRIISPPLYFADAVL